MKVAVITPTIGTDYLKDCLESVDKQTYGDLTHYIFFDGEEYDEKIVTQLTGFNRVKTIKLRKCWQRMVWSSGVCCIIFFGECRYYLLS